MTLKVRPRWRRLLYAPRLLYYYLRAGLSLWASLRTVVQVIRFKGPWTSESTAPGTWLDWE